MLFHSFLYIICTADIEGVIGALKDIDEIRHNSGYHFVASLLNVFIFLKGRSHERSEWRRLWILNEMKNEELGVVDDFRTADWVKLVKYPELVIEKSYKFLGC